MASTTVETENNAQYFQTIRPGRGQLVAFDNTSKQSVAFLARTSLIRVFPTQDCFVKIGLDPTVAAPAEGVIAEDTIFLPGGIIDFIGVTPGGKIAVTRSGSSGTLHITEAQ